MVKKGVMVSAGHGGASVYQLLVTLDDTNEAVGLKDKKVGSIDGKVGSPKCEVGSGKRIRSF